MLQLAILSFLGKLRCVFSGSASIHWLEYQFLFLRHMYLSESQSHWDWKRHMEFIWSTPPYWNRGHLQTPRILSKQFFNAYKGDSTTSGQPVPVLTCPQSVFRCSNGMSCVSVYAHYYLFCHWSVSTEHFTQRRACSPSSLHTFFIHKDEISPEPRSSSLGWTVPTLPTFPNA